jgi:hypothetical protein
MQVKELVLALPLAATMHHVIGQDLDGKSQTLCTMDGHPASFLHLA